MIPETTCLDEGIINTGLASKIIIGRQRELEIIKGALKGKLINPYIAGGKICVLGKRGVGKSILMRVILEHLTEETDCIAVYVDGRRIGSAKSFMGELCREFAKEVCEVFSDDEKVQTETAYMISISAASEISQGWIKGKAKELEGRAGVGIGFFNFIQVSLGLKGKVKWYEDIREDIKISVNLVFLREMLSAVIDKIKEKNRKVLICLDDLDQLDSKEEIEEFTNSLFTIENAVTLVVLRSEAMTENIRRNISSPIEVEGMEKNLLVKILKTRMDVIATEEEKVALEEGGIFEVADRLKEVTDRPFYFLRWLNYLYRNTEIDESPNSLKEMMRKYVRALYGLFGEDELFKLNKLFAAHDYSFISKDNIIEYLGLSEVEFDPFLSQGVIIPDNLFDQRRYELSPDLYILRILAEKK